MFEMPSCTPDEHEKRIEAHFGANSLSCPDGEPAPAARTIFLCFTNRCGSAWLASLLSATGWLPRAGEPFNHDFVIKRSTKQKLDSFVGYCRQYARGNAKNGFGAAKVGCRQLFMLAKWGYIGGLFADPRFIFVTRNDLLDQAISFSIADQTKAWTSGDRPVIESPEYAREDIVNRINGISSENALFEQFFALNGIRPLRVGYEAMIANPERTLARVSKYLDLPALELNLGKIPLAKQGNATNREWRARFLSGEPSANNQRRAAVV